jgi:hypothetical protein
MIPLRSILASSASSRACLISEIGGWPTFTFFVKVGTHAADAGVFILISHHRLTVVRKEKL